MLNDKQIKEIQAHLEKAQNPIFFFDNDPDGLCSFLLLRRHIGRGKGVAVKSFPDLNETYYRKVAELGGDYIFILDKPVVSKGFFQQAERENIPIVWIDHHEISGQEEIPEHVNYYNSSKIKNSGNFSRNQEGSEPVTYLCYKIINSHKDTEKDLWIAVIGCVADHFMPEFYKEFEEKYPDLAYGKIQSKLKNKVNSFDVLYRSQIGKVSRIFSFALKDRTTNVVNMLRFLIETKSPYEVLEETSKNFSMHRRFKQIDAKYTKLIKKAEDNVKGNDKLLFFQYGGDLSISSDIANELSYKFPDKVIVVVFVIGSKANISVRGKKIRSIVLQAIKGLENATGGGHLDAVGGKISVEDLEKFRDRIEKIVNGK
jgi:single-stranded DNA-specific DHH superfamily exonuclease